MRYPPSPLLFCRQREREYWQGVCLKSLSFPLFLQEWTPNHYSSCASAPPSPPCVDTHTVLTWRCRERQENPLGRAALKQRVPLLLWFTRVSASWLKMPFSVRYQNQNPDLYDNFKSMVQAPGGCSWNGFPLAYINLFQRNPAVDTQWGRNRLSVLSLGISWCLGDLGKKTPYISY